MNKRLHILYVGSLPPHPGGSAVSAQLLLGGFAAQGHRVQAFAAMSADALRLGDDFARNHPGIQVTRYPVQKFYQNGTDAAGVEFLHAESEQFAELLPPLLQERPDVVFIGREYLALHAMPLAKAHDVPVVIRMAGATVVALMAGAYPPALGQQLLTQFKQADRLLAVAAYQADWLRRLGLNNVQLIRNAVHVEQFSPRPNDDGLRQALRIPEDHYVILFAGNLNRRKRPLDVVAAAGQVSARRQDVTFVVLGTGQMQEEMEAACRRSSVWEHFRFPGWVAYEEVPRYMNMADLVVMASYGEGMARVYLEAQASGRVLVASDIAAAQEVVEHGETGLLFKLGDVEDLADKILLAVGDPELRERIGLKARARVAPHALEHAVADYLAVFEQLAPRPA